MKIFPCRCGVAGCRRKLLVERAGDGGFILTMIDPDFEWSEGVTAEELANRIVEAQEEFFLVAGEGSEGYIDLNDYQLADLRRWAGIEMPAPDRVLTADEVRAMFAALEKAREGKAQS